MVVLVLALALPMAAPAAANATVVPKVVTLLAGQDIEVGTVSVWNDNENLTVKYETIDGWMMTETHLHVADSVGAIPQTTGEKKGKGPAGNPIPGHFMAGDYYDPPVTEDTFIIDLDGWELETLLYIAAHAVVEKVEIETSTVQPALTWQRSVEEAGAIAHFAGYGGQWDPATDGFTILLDPEQLVWDNGTYHTPPGTPSDNFASWNYKGFVGTEGPSYDSTYGSDLRRFNAEFEMPGECTVTGGTLSAVSFDGIPINDNVYVFVNEDLIFWGGTRVYTGQMSSTFQGMTGASALRGTVSPAETDRWYIPGTLPALTNLTSGTNDIDVFTEENERWGGLGELVLSLDCETVTTTTETAWGDGDRFVPKGNWATYFDYEVQEELNLEGTWDVELCLNGVQYDRFIIITDHDGNVIEGVFGVSHPTTTGPIEGTVTELNIFFTYDPIGDYWAEFTGTIFPDGNSMSGTWEHFNSGIPGPYWEQNWSATRI